MRLVWSARVGHTWRDYAYGTKHDVGDCGCLVGWCDKQGGRAYMTWMESQNENQQINKGTRANETTGLNSEVNSMG